VISSILGDDFSPPVTGEDGRETIRVLDDIWKQINCSNSPQEEI
jgi:hypothetical protein